MKPSGEREAAKPWHDLTAEAVTAELNTHRSRGLSRAEATRRLQECGPNTLVMTGKVPWYVVFGRQFFDVLIAVLLAAAAISIALGEVGDAVTILVIVALNGLLGFHPGMEGGACDRGTPEDARTALQGDS